MIYEPAIEETINGQPLLPSGDEKETTETLSTRVELISTAIESLVNNVKKFVKKEEKLDVQKYLYSTDFVIESYEEFLNKLDKGYFNFDLNIRKLKGLLFHDLRKSYSVLVTTNVLIKEYAESAHNGDERANNVIEVMVKNSLDALESMKAGFQIIKAINEAFASKETTELSVQMILDLMGMVPTENPKVFLLKKSAKRSPVEVRFQTDVDLHDRTLTVEQAFSISTLLFNLTAGDTSKGVVMIYKLDNYDVIEVADDLGFSWPKNIIESYEAEYEVGYLNPGTTLKENSSGLKMMFNLSGQREAMYKVPDNVNLIECYDGDEATRTLKGVKLVFPHEELRRG